VRATRAARADRAPEPRRPDLASFVGSSRRRRSSLFRAQSTKPIAARAVVEP
jgi:hypothetical protein